MNSFQEHTSHYRSEIESQLSNLNSIEISEISLKDISKCISVIIQESFVIGDHCLLGIESDTIKDTDIILYYEFMYEFSAVIKEFLLPWRDSLLELKKLNIYSLDELMDDSKAKVFLERLLAKLNDITKEYLGLLKSSFSVNGPKDLAEQKVFEFSLQTNPWPVYKEQYIAIKNQCRDIISTEKQLRRVHLSFDKIEKMIQTVTSNCQKNIVQIKSIFDEAHDVVHQYVPNETAKATAYFQALNTDLVKAQRMVYLSETLDRELDALIETIHVPIAANGGNIVERDIQLRKRVRHWIESELIPLVQDSWHLVEGLNDSLKVSILNLSNRLVLMENEPDNAASRASDEYNIERPFELLQEKYNDVLSNFKEVKSIIEERIATDFLVSNLYDTKQSFLSISMESALSQMKTNQNKTLFGIRNWIQNKLKGISALQEIVIKEELLSGSEKVVRYIKNKTFDAQSDIYTNIFLTKGYIGESFVVGREEEMQHVAALVDNWKQGFRGSVIITGQRFSGKTLLCDYIIHRFFNENAIRLSPNTVIHFLGRTMNLGYDLAAGIAFIKKYSSANEMVVIIDDLELWNSPEHSLYSNIKSLIQVIDSLSDQIFFVVSTSNWMYKRLRQLFSFHQLFQTEMNMDFMNGENIMKAISIRHEATHKVLVDKNKDKVTYRKFNKFSKRLIYKSNGNVGESLRNWALSTRVIDKSTVQINQIDFLSLPDILNYNSAKLLTEIMFYKQTKENILRKQFGPSFNSDLKGVLQRLMGVGLVKKDFEGWLKVSDSIANDLGRLLEQKQLLRFQKNI